MQTPRHLVTKLTLTIALLGTTCAQSSLQEQPGKPPVRVSEGVMMGNLERRVEPQWPAGQTPQGSGVIVLRAVVRTDGTVRSVEVVSGETPFCEPALYAVKQWKFKPYLLNGEPTEVETAVTMRVGQKSTPESSALGTQPVRVLGGVMAGLRISGGQPTFPDEARANHINGQVVMRAILAKDGTVKSVEAVSGPPVLQTAYADAVRRWRYRPYLLNGQPVEVETTVTIHIQTNAVATD